MTLPPHLWNLLGKKTIRVRIVFGEAVIARGDRKQLSGVLHEKVKVLQSCAPLVRS